MPIERVLFFFPLFNKKGVLQDRKCAYVKKTKDTTASLLLKDFSVVSYFFLLLKSHHFCRICTAVGCVLLVALQNGQYFTGKVIRKNDTVRGFSVFSFYLYMVSEIFSYGDFF